MSVFDVDIPGIITYNIPARLRQPVIAAWLRCLCAPCVFLKNLFDANRSNNLYYLNHSGQVCFVEAALNDVFDPIARHINIDDPPYFDFIPLYLGTEIPPQSVQTLYLVTETTPAGIKPVLPLCLGSEVGVDDNCFVVMVPASLSLTAGQFTHLRAVVDKYRLPGKNNYSVQTF